jgi:signal transduction histidine kinase
MDMSAVFPASTARAGGVVADEKRALVVADDPDLQRFVEEALASKFAVVCIAPGTEREVRASEELHPALVVIEGHRFASIAREHFNLERQIESSRAARELAEQTSRTQAQLLRMVSHELRTPLGVIQLQTKALERSGSEGLSEAQATALLRTQRAAMRLLQLVDTLLDYTRAQSDQLTLRSEWFDLSLLVDEIVEEARADAECKGLELRVDVQSGLAPLCSDRRLVGIVITNLVGNAVKFTECGSIRVSASTEEGVHVVSVADTGPGIPQEQQNAVFEPFQRLERGGQHSPGFGLGLALVRQLTTTLGGSVQLESREGAGSTFRLRLPPLDVLPPM